MYKDISYGNGMPDFFNVIIEISSNSTPVKYEMNKEFGVLCVDRFIPTSMRYPCNYGYIPNTLSEDGDPVDVLVLSPNSLINGCIIEVRPIGILNMIDESGFDFKILSVPVNNLSLFYSNINDISDLNPLFLKKIEHFFKHYKDLEKNKWVKIEKWENVEKAKNKIISCIK